MAAILQNIETPRVNLDPRVVAAEDYFTAKNVVDSFKNRIKPHADIMAASIATLSSKCPQGETEITVFGNRTETFLQRTDETTKWQKVCEGLLPHLTTDQRALYRSLISTHGSTRTTKKFK